MPGVSQGYSMAAHENIHWAIESIFRDENLRKDAERILDLTFRAHVWEDIMLEDQTRFFWTLLRFVGFVLLIIPPLGIGILFLAPRIYRWSLQKRERAKAELAALIQTDPDRWEPLVLRIKQIGLNYGNSTHSILGTRQVIRLTE